MKAILFLILLIVFNTQAFLCQGNSIKMQTSVTGMGDKMKTEMTMYKKSKVDYKVTTTGSDFSLVISNLNGKVKIIRKDKGSNDLCAEGTTEEFNEENKKNKRSLEIKDINVEKLKETATIAGYECKCAKITYMTTGLLSMKMTNIVWYVENNKSSNEDYFDAYYDQPANSYTDATKQLGSVLKTESQGLAGVSTIVEVTEIKTVEFKDSDIDMDMSGCNKILTIKEYNEEVRERERSKNESRHTRFKHH